MICQTAKLPLVIRRSNGKSTLCSYIKAIWLVVWNMNFIFPYIGNFIIPTDELHHFSEGLGSTTNQLLKKKEIPASHVWLPKGKSDPLTVTIPKYQMAPPATPSSRFDAHVSSRRCLGEKAAGGLFFGGDLGLTVVTSTNHSLYTLSYIYIYICIYIYIYVPHKSLPLITRQIQIIYSWDSSRTAPPSALLLCACAIQVS